MVAQRTKMLCEQKVMCRPVRPVLGSTGWGSPYLWSGVSLSPPPSQIPNILILRYVSHRMQNVILRLRQSNRNEDSTRNACSPHNGHADWHPLTGTRRNIITTWSHGDQSPGASPFLWGALSPDWKIDRRHRGCGVEKHLWKSLFIYALSPLIRLANWMSLGMMVTRFAWIAHKLVSSKIPTRYASEASWIAWIADDWNRRSALNSWAISRTNLWNGSFLTRSSVDFWYFRISLSDTVPGRNLWGFLIPPAEGCAFRAALVARVFLGAFPPVDFLAVCFVLAILFFWVDFFG